MSNRMHEIYNHLRDVTVEFDDLEYVDTNSDSVFESCILSLSEGLLKLTEEVGELSEEVYRLRKQVEPRNILRAEGRALRNNPVPKLHNKFPLK